MNKRQRNANRATAFMARWALHGTRQSFGGTAGSGSMVILSSRDFTRGTTARPTFVCYDDIESGAPTAVEEAAEFATSLDSFWVSTSVLSPMRYMDARLNRYGFLCGYAARNDGEDIPAMLLKGSPVCLHGRAGYVVLGTSPDDNVRLACVRSGRNEPHYVGFVALDLTDATGRAHAAWWARLAVEQRTDAWRNVASAAEWALVQRAEVNGYMTPEQIDTLARLVLRLAGRTL